MTTNPTPAEVEAAYMRVHDAMEFGDGQPKRSDIATLLAAVARDTLGWREVSRDVFMEHKTFCKAIRAETGDLHYWIKDAPR